MRFQPAYATGTVLGTYLSPTPDRERPDYFFTHVVDSLEFDLEGIVGDRHHGPAARAGGRVKHLHPKGSQMRNNRQWLAIAPDELATIEGGMNATTGAITPERIGANLLIGGLGPVSQFAPMTYLVCSAEGAYRGQPREGDVVLVVYADAIPCQIADRGIADALGREPAGAFIRASNTRRGAVGWVERGGLVRRGDTVSVLVPTGRD